MVRKTLIAVAAVTALFCLSSSAFAQTVDEIVAKNLAAKGGIEKLKSIQSLRSTGTMSAQGQMVTITSSAKRPNMTRQEILMGGQTMLMVFDGTTARMINPMVSPTPVDMPAEQLEMIKDQSDIDGPLVDYKAKGYQIEFVGAEMVDGKKALHLRIHRKSMPVQDVYLDSVTYLEAKVSTSVPGSGVIETQFGDYRAVDGMTMPFSIKTVAAGMTLNEMKLTKIEVNVKLDDAIFKIK
jgi:outer membrane lipoprotein-sorting protein